MEIDKNKLNGKFYKPEWISVRELQPPTVMNGHLYKGAIIINQVDPLLHLFPWIGDFYYIIERHGWFGLNEATKADIMMVEDPSALPALNEKQLRSILLPYSSGDFVDTDCFYPLSTTPSFDVLQIACWSPRKRIELFIKAAAKLPTLQFVQLGHFENNGTEEEISYRNYCINLAKRCANNVHFPHVEQCRYEVLPHRKEDMNKLINEARLSVITTQKEGINRFKMESLAANRPCLVANDAGSATQKHITQKTGALFDPTAESLSEKIIAVLEQSSSYNPRFELLKVSGNRIATKALSDALHSLCQRDHQPFLFKTICYDGRNESLAWGENALKLLSETHNSCQGLLRSCRISAHSDKLAENA